MRFDAEQHVSSLNTHEHSWAHELKPKSIANQDPNIQSDLYGHIGQQRLCANANTANRRWYKCKHG